MLSNIVFKKFWFIIKEVIYLFMKVVFWFGFIKSYLDKNLWMLVIF